MTAAYVSIVFGSVFLILVTLLHFLKRELDPSWRMISEYEIGRHGWMMRLAFFCWGASVLAATIAIWPSLQTIGGVIGRWWLLVIVIFLFGAGIFKADPITDQTNNLVNRLHALCGMVVILTFPIVATLAASSLMKNLRWLPVRGLLVLAVVLVWAGMIAYFATIIIARSKNPKVGEDGTRIYMGWPNRFNVVTYLIWIFIMAGSVIHLL
jgi:hypothetical protein